MPDRYAMTVEEVAKELKIAKNTVYELIKRGELQSYRVGRKVRIDKKDLDAYVNGSKKGNPAVQVEPPRIQVMKPTSGIPSSFVISGQDFLLDVLSNLLQTHQDNIPAFRSYVGSIQGLNALYMDTCQVAAIHLYDQETNTYNVPFVKHLVPGISCVIIRLAKRYQGFYVKKGNPKNIKSWADLGRDDVKFVNREKGSGTRVLLDQMLKRHKISPFEIQGYYQEQTSHLAIVNMVAGGSADVGMGTENVSYQLEDVDFIRLHEEYYDVVLKKENLKDPTYKLLYDLLTSDKFKNNVYHMKGYDLSELGDIVDET